MMGLRALAPDGAGIFRRNPAFARVYAAQLISFAGDWFTTVALLGLVLKTTHNPTMAGLLLAVQTFPFAVTAPFAGIVADRVDRKTLMIAADVLRAMLALGLLAARTPETIWIAFALTGFISMLNPFFETSSSAALPNLVEPSDLARANVLSGSAWGTMLAVGAALGGAVVALFGRDAAFIGDAVSFALSAALVMGVRRRFNEEREPRKHVTIFEDVLQTLRFARTEPRVGALLLVKGGFGLAGGVIVLASVFAVEVFHRGDAAIGLMMSARGLGALAGPFLFRRWIRGDDRRLFTGIALALGLFALCYGLLGISPSLELALLAVMGAHLGGGSTWTLSTYGLQRFTPDAIRGRVFGFDYALITLTISASVLGAGAAASHFGARTAALAGAALGIAWAISWRTLTVALGLTRGERAVAEEV